MANSFPTEVAALLGSYVYRLIDPRNGETFYVGRGKADRVFQHVRAAISEDREDLDGMPLKVQRIRNIINQLGDSSVIHIIHRHGMNDEQASLVEAALIDAFPGLTNEIGGEGSADFGPANAAQLIQRYGTETFRVVDDHKLLLITINRSFSEDSRSVLDATRAAWRIDADRASHADAILGVAFGIVRGVFVASEWLTASRSNFPFLDEDMLERKGFTGSAAPSEFQDVYFGKRVPPELLNKPGARGPLRYNFD